LKKLFSSRLGSGLSIYPPDNQLAHSSLHFRFLTVKYYLDLLISYSVVIFVASFVIAVLAGIFTRQLIKPLVIMMLNHTDSAFFSSILDGIKLFLNHLGAASGDFSKMMLIWVTMAGSSLMFSTRGHLGVDYFVGKMDRRSQIWLSIFVYFMIFFFIIAILFIGGIKITISSWNQQMQNIPLSKGFIYLILPLSGLFTLFYTLFQIMSDFFGWDSLKEENK